MAHRLARTTVINRITPAAAAGIDEGWSEIRGVGNMDRRIPYSGD